MIKFYLAAAIAASGLSANEIQVFSSGTNAIKITGKSSFEKLYYGPAEGYYADPAKYLSAKTLVTASARGLASAGVSDKRHAENGYIPVTAEAPGRMAYARSGTDHDYIYVSVVTNDKGEQSVMYTLIVARDAISDSDGEALAVADQKRL